MSRYLVTGATGFLGGHLVAQLRRAGDDVVALCRTDAPSLAEQGIPVCRGDVLDAQSVREAARGCDGLFHCAGKVSRRAQDAGELYRIHVDGTKTTLDACKQAGVRRAVVASTSGIIAVSKDANDVLDESAPPPVDIIAAWPYYRSKLYAEKAALDRNQPGFEVVAVNPTLLLGPGDIHGSSTGDVVNFLEQKVPVIPGGGLSFVDVRDAAAGMILAMHKGRPGERYLLGAVNLTVEAFFARLSRISGVPSPRIRMPRSVLLARYGSELLRELGKYVSYEPPVDRISIEMAQHFWYLDAGRAQRELGWAAREPGDTLFDTIEDLKARGVVWPRV